MSTLIDDLSNPQLVAIGVFLLDGDAQHVDREDVAIKVNKIAPGRFNWRKYPERIDLRAIAYALYDAKKPKSGGLLVGTNKMGWMLSPAGMQWVQGVDLEALLGTDVTRQRKHSVAASQDAERERLRTSRAYQLYENGDSGQITLQDFYQFARVNNYFHTKARQKRYTIIENAVVDDNDLSALWRLLRERFFEEMK
jgi:hypothetical protein